MVKCLLPHKCLDEYGDDVLHMGQHSFVFKAPSRKHAAEAGCQVLFCLACMTSASTACALASGLIPTHCCCAGRYVPRAILMDLVSNDSLCLAVACHTHMLIWLPLACLARHPQLSR